jgi:hypothetical protein
MDLDNQVIREVINTPRIVIPFIMPHQVNHP